jgi:hypothetical protein
MTKAPVKGWPGKDASPVGKKGLTDNYYVYQHKLGEWAIYMFYENKTGNKKRDRGLEPYQIFLDKDIQYDVLGQDGQKPATQERD